MADLTLPNSIEAEQALLGCILAYPDTWPLVAPRLKPEHFYEGLHARLYEKILEMSGEGKFVSPIVLKSVFEHDATLKELKEGFGYISRLLGAAGPKIGITGYADLIRGLAERRAVMRASDEMSQIAAAETDAGEFRKSLSSHITTLMHLIEGSAERKTTATLQEAAGDVMRRLDRLKEGGADPNAVLSGLAALDRMTGGLRRGQYAVIGARPSMGKTALGVQVSANVASRGGGVAYFSLEMPTADLTPRFLSSHLWTPGAPSPPYKDIQRGAITDEQRRELAGVIQEMDAWPLVIDDDAGLTAAEVEARARVIAARFKARGVRLDLLVVDHIHKMRAPDAKNRVDQFSEISAGLAEAAKRLDVPLIALAQLNRGVEGRDDKRPTLADLRESGAIEQDADLVAFLYRPAYYLERDRGRDANGDVELYRSANALEVIIAKQRSGPIGKVNLWADMGTNVIRDRSEAP